MRLCSHRVASLLAYTIVVFLLVFSFNAYACLLPVIGATAAAMDSSCSTSDTPPVNQFCESFKTLGVQSADKLHQNSDCHTICQEETSSLARRIIHKSSRSRLVDHPTVGLPEDLLLKISVLRI